jgi:hypothetical protein
LDCPFMSFMDTGQPSQFWQFWLPTHLFYGQPTHSWLQPPLSWKPTHSWQPTFSWQPTHTYLRQPIAVAIWNTLLIYFRYPTHLFFG